MIRRFSLYGFLKNQQYYDYSLVLAFVAMGLDYATIGLLVGVREVVTAIMEIPSGVYADRTGRRRALLVSLVSYIVSFGVFGACGLWAERGHPARGLLVSCLGLAMLLFAVGEAFRSGTHKAMIFTWLRREGREEERAAVYGLTRSWSKLGSAVSVVIACGIILVTRDFVWVFFFAIGPYLLNLFNIATYPPELDGEAATGERTGLSDFARALWRGLRHTLGRPALRRLLAEDMGFDGFFKVSKGYLQPILLAVALPLSARLFHGAELTEAQRSVVTLGPTYVALFLLSSLASRQAHRLVPAGGDAATAMARVWALMGVVFGLLAAALWAGLTWLPILGFAIFYFVQNLWRPLLLTRLGALTDDSEAATVLSIESQARSLFALALAPTLGYLVDLAGGDAHGTWPVFVVGSILCASFWLLGRLRRSTGDLA